MFIKKEFIAISLLALMFAAPDVLAAPSVRSLGGATTTGTINRARAGSVKSTTPVKSIKTTTGTKSTGTAAGTTGSSTARLSVGKLYGSSGKTLPGSSISNTPGTSSEIKKRLDELEIQVDKLDQETGQRIDSLDTDIADIKDEIDEIKEEIKNINVEKGDGTKVYIDKGGGEITNLETMKLITGPYMGD